jgi:predicted nucleic acid-binding protein
LSDLMTDALRRIKPERKTDQLTPRANGSFHPAVSISGRIPIVVDTNVYIKSVAGTLPQAAVDVLDNCVSFHTTVCISEIGTGLAGLHPNSSGYARLRNHYEALFRKIPTNRILTPDDDIWIEAGLVAGTLARTQNLQAHQRKEFLNDCLIYLTATKAGIPVLTENKMDFDLVQQVVGRGIFIHY